jgi:pyrroline-5-carboxylate reductase
MWSIPNKTHANMRVIIVFAHPQEMICKCALGEPCKEGAPIVSVFGCVTTSQIKAILPIQSLNSRRPGRLGSANIVVCACCMCGGGC